MDQNNSSNNQGGVGNLRLAAWARGLVWAERRVKGAREHLRNNVEYGTVERQAELERDLAAAQLSRAEVWLQMVACVAEEESLAAAEKAAAVERPEGTG